MAKLKNINGHFVESDYENALIAFLEREGWQYLYGDSITRANRKEVLNMEDLLQFLKDNNKNVKDEELQRIADNVRLVGADTDFATLHKVYKWMVNGVPAVDKDGRPTTVNLSGQEYKYLPRCQPVHSGIYEQRCSKEPSS